ncbi:MAG: DoxX family protein [Bacteroidales bacterium]|nr:DoxX family protein [Bacteroidales bacterium]
MKTKNIIGLIARVVIALVFMASAITKYISIDAFDQFVYEHQIFPWVTTTIVTRLLIACEFTLGFLLLIGVKAKEVKWLIIVFLVGFTVYIALKPYLFNTVDEENCHCFGEVLILSDSQTLIKNIILLALSYFMFWDKGLNLTKAGNDESEENNDNGKAKPKEGILSWLKSHQNPVAAYSFIVILILFFFIKMPDTLQYKLYGKAAKINEPAFEYIINHGELADLNVTKGKKIVCMYSPFCKYCSKTAKRFDVIRQKYNLKDEDFVLIFWDKEEAVQKFFSRNEIKPLPHRNIPAKVFLEATYGKQPVIILLNNGKVEKLLKYPNILEKDILDFLKK